MEYDDLLAIHMLRIHRDICMFVLGLVALSCER